MRLSKYVLSVRDKLLELLGDDRFPRDQQELLQGIILRAFNVAAPDDWAQPLGLLYATYRGFGRKTDDQARLVGAFCICYLASLDLFDDVQDDDLAGKPIESAGVPVAINSALALMLVGLRALGEAALLETDAARRGEYLKVFNRASLVAVGAQHVDLTNTGGRPSPEQVLEMNRAKTSSVALLSECGALLGGANAENTKLFAEFGSDFSALVQIVDDVRDLYGKEHSPDLAAGKVTYPIACFHELASAPQVDEFSRLRQGLPESADAIRELLHEVGAVDASAATVEELRAGMHRRLSGFDAPRAEHRLLLSMVDSLASTLYEPPPLEDSIAYQTPRGGFHDVIAQRASRFVEELDLEGTLAVPSLSPWPAPLYLFEPQADTIRYPDLQDLRGDVVGQFSDTLGLEPEQVERAMEAGMPLLLAHELMHAWRHACGRLSDDAWHEEFVANRLAMGYALRFEPEAAQATLHMSRLILERVPAGDEAAERAILARSRVQGDAADYDLSFAAACRVHAHMLLEASATCDFELDQSTWLSREVPPDLRSKRHGRHASAVAASAVAASAVAAE